MIKEPTNLDELREEVNQSKKLPFRSRIYRILHYSLSHPEDYPVIGLFWDDNIHFICNSKVAGDFLGLKDNSLNTNLRDYGFIIDESFSSTDLMQKYGSLSNANRWKRRFHFTLKFNKNSTEDEINVLPRPTKKQPENVTYAPITNPFPEESPKVREFFLNHQEIVYDIKDIKRRIEPDDPKWRDNLLEFAIDDWSKITQQTQQGNVEADDIACIAIDECEEEIPEFQKDTISSNIKHLLQENIGFSQTSLSVQFPSFFKLFLHFGRLSRLALRVRDVSYTEQPQQPSLMDTNQDSFFSQPFFSQSIFSQSQHSNEGWCFCNWFIPSAERDAVMRHFNQYQSEWAVKFSSVPTRFTFVRKSVNNDLEITHINFNPIAPNDSFNIEGNGATFDSLPLVLESITGVAADQIKTKGTTIQDYTVVDKKL